MFESYTYNDILYNLKIFNTKAISKIIKNLFKLYYCLINYSLIFLIFNFFLFSYCIKLDLKIHKKFSCRRKVSIA